MKFSNRRYIFFSLLLWALVSPLSSFALDPGKVVQTLFHVCDSNLTESIFPKNKFDKIEPLTGDVTAPKIAEKINGYQFKGKSGKTYFLLAHTAPETPDIDDDKVWIWVLDENKIPVFHANQVVQKKTLTLSSISNTISLFQKAFLNHFSDSLKYKLEELTQVDLKRMQIIGDWKFTPKTELESLTFNLSNGLEKGTLKFIPSSSGWAHVPDERLESIHPELRYKLKQILKPGVIDEAISFVLNQRRTQMLAESQKPVLDAENDGIATALHRAYLEAVPSGTRKFIQVGNTETLEILRKARTHEELIRYYPDTKLGKIFTNSGWKLVDLYQTETDGYLIEIIKP